MTPEEKRQLKELMDWKQARERQQITFPLDRVSIDVLSKYFMRLIGQYVYFGGAAGNPFLVYEGIQDKTRFEIEAALIEYIASAGTDFVSILYPNIPFTVFANDESLVLFTTDTEPGGLSGAGGTLYYVVNATADGLSFQLSLTLGGAAVNITSGGIGRQFLVRA